MPLILLKTLKNTSFIIFFRKKGYCGNIQCFLFIVWWKQWNKQKIIKKLTFSVKRNFFREIAYIPFLWLEQDAVFFSSTSPKAATTRNKLSSSPELNLDSNTKLWIINRKSCRWTWKGNNSWSLIRGEKWGFLSLMHVSCPKMDAFTYTNITQSLLFLVPLGTRNWK